MCVASAEDTVSLRLYSLPTVSWDGPTGAFDVNILLQRGASWLWCLASQIIHNAYTTTVDFRSDNQDAKTCRPSALLQSVFATSELTVFFKEGVPFPET